MLSKVVSSSIFKVFGMTRPGIEPRSPGPLANTLTAGALNNQQYAIKLNPTNQAFLYIGFNLEYLNPAIFGFEENWLDLYKLILICFYQIVLKFETEFDHIIILNILCLIFMIHLTKHIYNNIRLINGYEF